jgi:alkanesulfonate monooxygenase SsuD/methylene tetrahydromethanopterin reductase-like flavin-dependent oxidoreductase (luciferase family)
MEFWTGAFGITKMRMMPSALADGYDQFVQGAVDAEKMGFDAYGAPEHHFTYDGFLPVPLQALAAAAAKTSKIRLVTGAMLQTLYEPMEAAEHAATLDVLSGGRSVLGLGMGYRPLEFDGMGTAKRTRGVRLREAMEVLRLASTEDSFSHHGRHYRFDDVSLHPTPVQRPFDMWFCGGTTEAAARRAGEAGLPYWLANSPYERVEVIVKAYREAGRNAGWPEDRLKVAAFKDVFIGATKPEAEMMREAMVEAFYSEHILGYGYLVDDEGNHVYNPAEDHPMYLRFLDSLFCGSVDEVVSELKLYEDLGIEALFFPSIQREVISTQIMPEFK